MNFPSNPSAERRIAEYLPKTYGLVRRWQRLYPSDDVEPEICHALYQAAYTFDESFERPFELWWWIIIRSRTRKFRAAQQRRIRGHKGTQGKQGRPFFVGSLRTEKPDQRAFEVYDKTWERMIATEILDALPCRRRYVMDMRFRYSYQVQEIAKILSLSKWTVKEDVKAAIKAMRARDDFSSW